MCHMKYLKVGHSKMDEDSGFIQFDGIITHFLKQYHVL